MSKTQEINMTSAEFQPKNEFILVKPRPLPKGEKKTESGLIIAITQNTSVLDRPSSGVVVAVGSEIDEVKEGDFIIWPETDGIDLAFDDGEFMLLREDSVIGFKKS